MIIIRDLYKYNGNQLVLRGINLNVKRGGAVAIIGPSGSGKSTLLRCINCLENFQKGGIIIDSISNLISQNRISVL